MPAQPSSSASVQNSQELFRIYQPIESPGDIFEVDSSCKAVFIGQNSDVAEVRLQYFDEQEGPDLMNTVDVSVNGPFVGRMDALLDTTYASLGQKARVLAFPVDLVDNAYVRPTSPLFTPARRFNIPA